MKVIYEMDKMPKTCAQCPLGDLRDGAISADDTATYCYALAQHRTIHYNPYGELRRDERCPLKVVEE